MPVEDKCCRDAQQRRETVRVVEKLGTDQGIYLNVYVQSEELLDRF